jgi:hypothetical protein
MKVMLMIALVGIATALPASAGSIRYLCEFPIAASPDGLENQDDFILEFTTDTVTGNSIMVGNNGFTNVFKVEGTDGVTFLEQIPSGAVQSTTIDGKGNAVHSRHSIIGELFPSQSYGQCQKTDF